MKILEIYKKYQIMPQQAEHQVKVAGVAEVILNHLSFILDRQDIIAACLLHDMGNIVKFDLSISNQLHPGMFTEKDLEHWQKIKEEFIGKYGKDSHRATMAIVKEAGVGRRILELVDCVGFHQGKQNFESEDFGKKICAYSDMRVMPNGVASLEERMADLRARYANHPEGLGNNKRDEFEQALRGIEKQIFEKCKIKPQEITEEAIKPEIEKLRNFEIVDK